MNLSHRSYDQKLAMKSEGKDFLGSLEDGERIRDFVDF
jgi:hypothetical protein